MGGGGAGLGWTLAWSWWPGQTSQSLLPNNLAQISRPQGSTHPAGCWAVPCELSGSLCPYLPGTRLLGVHPAPCLGSSV